MDHGGIWGTVSAPCWVQGMGEQLFVVPFSLGNTTQPRELLDKGRSFTAGEFSGGSQGWAPLGAFSSEGAGAGFPRGVVQVFPEGSSPMESFFWSMKHNGAAGLPPLPAVRMLVGFIPSLLRGAWTVPVPCACSSCCAAGVGRYLYLLNHRSQRY